MFYKRVFRSKPYRTVTQIIAIPSVKQHKFLSTHTDRLHLFKESINVLNDPTCDGKVSRTLDIWEHFANAGKIRHPPTHPTDIDTSVLHRIESHNFGIGISNGLNSTVCPHDKDWESFVATGSYTQVEVIPEHPARPDRPKLVSGKEFQRPKVPINVYILHAIAHVELNAIDLYWDTVARFVGVENVPTQLFIDLIDIARDEAKHFQWLSRRLEQLDASYGDLPAHSALWEDSIRSRDSLQARLAVIPLVQEAKALDAAPRLTEKLKSVGDQESAAILQQICDEEVGHVYKGLKWFRYLCDKRGEDHIPTFHTLVRKYIHSPLQGPFNEAARALAWMTPDWYLPVASRARKRSIRNMSGGTNRKQNKN